jgi:tRNA G10  N-methylase Trm11
MNSQYFKTVYYADHPAENTSAKTITIAFNNAELSYFQKIKEMSSQEIRELAGIESYQDLFNIAQEEDRSVNNIIKRRIKKNIMLQGDIKSEDSTFKKSKVIPFQRWYPYIEGYSPDYVHSLIQKYSLAKAKNIYDPFAGTGTTIFGADEFNIKTIFSEINPLLQFIIETKVSILASTPQVRKAISDNLREIANDFSSNFKTFEKDERLNYSYGVLFGDSEYFETATYKNILKLRTYIDKIGLTDMLLSDCLTIAVLSSLIPISFLKKQGDVRFKNAKELAQKRISMIKFISMKLIEIADDVANMDCKLKNKPEFIISNAKDIGLIKNIEIDAVITSPPYLNGTNYFRNTKLELWFLRYIQFEDDLRFLRNQALTSGINDVNRSNTACIDDEVLSKSILLQKAFVNVTKNAYDRRIPVMVNNYFSEMSCVFQNLLPLLNSKSKVIIDIGDSIFGGVHIPTDDILIELFDKHYNLIEKKEVRKRRSKNKMMLHQSLLVFEKSSSSVFAVPHVNFYGMTTWNRFKQEIPHQTLPYSKRNWGHPNHSLCSYQGKLKPAIAHHLVTTFVPRNGKMLDPFSGVGTIPFEAALNGIISYGIDISLPAYYISLAKVSINDKSVCYKYINKMHAFIGSNRSSPEELTESRTFGFNKTLSEYYEAKTLEEIILARRFLKEYAPQNSSETLVVASLLHILHGNRPYALSRRSHPIVPYAPQGDFEYKNLIIKLTEKVEKSFETETIPDFIPGKVFNQDATSIWPQEINNLDAVITSPPFFDSTRFYLANWIRIWFAGWSPSDFKYQINSFIEEKQKKDFSIYEKIFRQTRERLKNGGVFVLHLGKSYKCDMAKELQKTGKRWFNTADLFNENVEHCESHGIRDKGTVTSHQYLVLI